MAVGFRSSSNTGNDNLVSSLAPAVPSGAATDDVMVVILTRWNPINPAVTAPAGFTEFGTQIVNGDAKMNTYWKRLTGADAGTYTFSWGSDMWSHVHCFCMTGVKTTGDPIGSNYASWTGTAGTFGSTQVTTAFVPGLVWSGYNDSAGTHTPPTNFTEVIDFDSGTGAYYLPGSSGTQTASGATASSSSNAIAVLVALEPEPSVIALTTDSVTNIGGTTATGNGTITSDGGSTITERGFCWSTSPNPTTSDSKVTASGTIGSYSATLTSLSNNTTYHVRAYAINANGTVYGNDLTFLVYNISLSWIRA